MSRLQEMQDEWREFRYDPAIKGRTKFNILCRLLDEIVKELLELKAENAKRQSSPK